MKNERGSLSTGGLRLHRGPGKEWRQPPEVQLGGTPATTAQTIPRTGPQSKSKKPAHQHWLLTLEWFCSWSNKIEQYQRLLRHYSSLYFSCYHCAVFTKSSSSTHTSHYLHMLEIVDCKTTHWALSRFRKFCCSWSYKIGEKSCANDTVVSY